MRIILPLLTFFSWSVISASSSLAQGASLEEMKLTTEPSVLVDLYYSGKEEEAESPSVSDDDYFDDAGTKPVPKKENNCEGGSIVQALNCEVTDAIKNARPSTPSGDTQSGDESEAKATETASESSEAESEVGVRLRVTLTPKVVRQSDAQYTLSFELESNSVVVLGMPSSKTQAKLNKDEGQLIPNAIRAWKKSYSQEQLTALWDQGVDHTLDIRELFAAAEAYKLESDATLEMKIVTNPSLVGLDVVTDQSDPYVQLYSDAKDYDLLDENALFGGPQTRNLIAYLKNYKFEEHGWPEFTDPDGVATYRALSVYKEADEVNQRERDDLFDAWGINGREGPVGAQAILVRAELPAKTLPSFKLLAFKEKAAPWEFLYADVGAAIQLAREVSPGEWRPAQSAMMGDRLRVEVRLTQANGAPSVPLYIRSGALAPSQKSLPVTKGIKLVANDTGDGIAYATAPLAIKGEGYPTYVNPLWQQSDQELLLPALGASKSRVGTILASVDKDYRRETYLAPIAPIVKQASAAFPVYITTPQSTLWKEALAKTSQCKAAKDAGVQYNLSTWDSLPAQEKDRISRISINSLGFYVKSFAYSYSKADKLVNPIEWGKRAAANAAGVKTSTVEEDLKDAQKAIGDSVRLWESQPAQPSAGVTFGHHAALLLLRDELLRMLEQQNSQLRRITQDEKRLRKAFSDLPRSWAVKGNEYADIGGMFKSKRNNPYMMIRIKSPDQKQELSFDQLYAPMRQLKKDWGLSEEKIEAWRLRQFEDASRQLSTMALNSVQEIQKINPCDSKELLKAVADIHGPVAASLKPKLVKNVVNPASQTTYWTTDMPARNWVDMVSDLGVEVAARNKEADIDNMALQAQVMVASLGSLVVAAEGASLGAAGLAIDAVDAGMMVHDLGKAGMAYYNSDGELAKAGGKALILGSGYYQAAEKQAKSVREAFAQQLVMAGVSVTTIAATRLMVKREWNKAVGDGVVPENTSNISAGNVSRAPDAPETNRLPVGEETVITPRSDAADTPKSTPESVSNSDADPSGPYVGVDERLGPEFKDALDTQNNPGLKDTAEAAPNPDADPNGPYVGVDERLGPEFKDALDTKNNPAPKSADSDVSQPKKTAAADFEEAPTVPPKKSPVESEGAQPKKTAEADFEEAPTVPPKKKVDADFEEAPTVPPKKVAEIDPDTPTVPPKSMSTDPNMTKPHSEVLPIPEERRVSMDAPTGTAPPPDIVNLPPPARAPPQNKANVPINYPETANGRSALRFKDGQQLGFDEVPLGQGSYNTAVKIDGEKVARMPGGHDGRPDPIGIVADKGGRKVFKEAGIDTNKVRLVEEKGPPIKVDEIVEIPVERHLKGRSSDVRLEPGDEIEILENFTHGTLKDRMKGRKPKKMTVEEAIAYDKGVRELNKKGLIALDLKYDNFGFEPVSPGSKELRLVILDSGGIVPVKGKNAAKAREIQTAIDTRDNTPYNNLYKKGVLLNEFNNDIDAGAVGIDSVDNVPFNPMGVSEYEKGRALSSMTRAAAENHYATLRATGQ